MLTRVFGIEDDVGQAGGERARWQRAERLLPQGDAHRAMPRYTQGLMDLGATVCATRKPNCDACPLAGICVAKRMGTQLQFPVKSKKLKRSVQTIWLLWAQARDGSVWLSKRPTPGVWAGLYCFPLFDDCLLYTSPNSRDRT